MGKREYVRLGDIASVQSGGTPSRSDDSYWKGGDIPWVKISDINGDRVSKTEEFITPKGLNKSSTKIFSKGTIIFSIFASLGEVAILEMDAATNQAIAGITPHDNRIDRRYLFYYLKSIKKSILEIGRGVAQNNINLSILRDQSIPVPTLNIQQKIADVLDKASALIEMRKAQIEKLDLLIKSQFIEMFGDPVTNPKGWEIDKLFLIGTCGRGVSKHRPRNDPRLLGGKYPLIQTGDVANSDLFINSYSSTYSEYGLAQSKLWMKGTLCITIAANIAKTAILGFDACFPDSVVGFLPNCRTNVYFVNTWFGFFQEILEKQAPESAQKNINLSILNDLNVICPSIELQNKFANFVESIYNRKKLLQESLGKIELNYKSLMQKCFSGEMF